MKLNVHLWGSKLQYLTIFLAGLFAALAYEPINFTIAPFLAFPLWLYILEVNQEKGWRKHFALGFWFGLGYFTTGLYWIAFSLGVDLDKFWWLVPFGIFGIPTGLSVYLGVTAVLLKHTQSTGISRCFWFALLWTVSELFWGSGPLALPWNPLGIIWANFDPLIQIISVVGIYGLTLATALLISSPILFRKYQFRTPQITFISILAISFISLSSWGLLRPDKTAVKQQGNPVIVRIVQPNVPQELDWQPEKAGKQFYDLIALTGSHAEKKPDIIIWPESALPLLLDEDATARGVVAETIAPNGQLISGSLRRVFTKGEKVKIYNSLIVVGADASVKAIYDKFHLVPFGEYLPLRAIIPSSITKITSGETDFSRGPGLDIIRSDPMPAFSPLICFEGIFSGSVVAKGQQRPEWLLNITNDAWFGNSSGPYQHLQLARMRSIEEGLPLVRAANTGISAVFDAFGRQINKKSLGEKGVLDVSLPPALQEPTIFALYGQLILIIMMAISFGIALLLRRP